jgi:hypothetical protein
MTTRYDICFIDIDTDDLALVGAPSWFGWITRLSDADERYFCPLSRKGDGPRPSAHSKGEILQQLYRTAHDLGFKYGGLRDHSTGKTRDAVVRGVEFGEEGVKTWAL